VFTPIINLVTGVAVISLLTGVALAAARPAPAATPGDVTTG
jgi:hypothetical protein